MADKRRAVGIGIIGCGRVAQSHHLPVLTRLAEAQVVAVSEIDQQRLDQVADKFAVPCRDGDYRKLLDNPAVEAVAVCVPAAHHLEVALASLEAGKHVLVEKPLALSLAEADRLIAHAAAASVTTTVGFNLRSHRLLRRARRIIEDGTLGRIQLIRSAWGAGLRHRQSLPPWRSRRDAGGGVLYEMAVHHFDLWRYLLGEEITEVWAACLSAPTEDDAAVVTARLTGGVLASSVFSQGTSDSHQIEIFGQAGRLSVSVYRTDGLELYALSDLPGGIRSRFRRAVHALKVLPQAIALGSRGGVYLESYSAQWRAFIDSIRRGASPACSFEDGRRALEVVLAASESADTARPVAIDPTPTPRATTSTSSRLDLVNQSTPTR